jgi:hypothetical protein
MTLTTRLKYNALNSFFVRILLLKMYYPVPPVPNFPSRFIQLKILNPELPSPDVGLLTQLFMTELNSIIL